MQNPKMQIPQEYKIPRLSLPCIDKIVEIQKGKSAIGSRHVEAKEAFFQDHFVDFPVLPGVLQLEGLTQISTWHIRVIEDFSKSQIRMTHCSPAKFSQLVHPGSTILFESELMKVEGNSYKFKAKVTLDGKTTSSARFTLESTSLNDLAPTYAHIEDSLNQKFKNIYDQLNS